MTTRPRMLNEKKRKSPVERAVNVLFALVGAVLILFFLFLLYVNTACFVVEVTGHSMDTTLYGGDSWDDDGDRIYVLKNAKAKRGDIVVVDVSGSNHFSGALIIKRLIAIEGDEVKIIDGGVEIKYAGTDEFVKLKEKYAISPTEPSREADFQTEWTVGEGEIFCLGDNRPVSEDSRAVGCLKMEDVIGVVPNWAIKIKSFSTAWEKFRGTIALK